VFFAALVVVTFPVLLKPWSQDFGWSREAVSTAFGIAAAVAALGAAPLGHLLDRIPARRVAIPGLLTLGLAFASLSLLTPRVSHLYAVFAILGLAGICTSPVAYGRAISTWFRARRGMALAIVITGGALGGMLHPPVMDALIRRFGWRAACAVLGACVLALGVPAVARFVRDRPDADRHAAGAPGASFARAARSRMFVVLALAMLCGTMLQNSVIVHLAALLTDRGVAPDRAAVALSAMAAAAVTGRLVTGWLIDRVFAARVMTVLLALAAAGALLLAESSTFGAGVVAAVLVGFATGGEADVIPYLLTRYFGLRSFSALYGAAWTIGAVGGAAGPVLMGRTFDATGSYAPMLVRVAVVALAAAGLALALPRPGAHALGGRGWPAPR